MFLERRLLAAPLLALVAWSGCHDGSHRRTLPGGFVLGPCGADVPDRATVACGTFVVEGQTYPLPLDPPRFVALLLRAFRPGLLATVAAVIHATALGDYAPISMLAQVGTRPGSRHPFALAMHLSVVCGEEIPFSSLADAEAVARAHPRFAFMSAYAVASERCRHWIHVPLDAREDTPVATDRPVLFLSGELDPLLDPAWAEDARAAIPASLHLRFPDAAHGVLHAACGWQAAAAFIDAPNQRPTHPCVFAASPPRFVVDPRELLRATLDAGE